MTPGTPPHPRLLRLHESDGVVVFGASAARRGPLALLASLGQTCVALSDNDVTLHGQVIDGLPVLPPGELPSLPPGVVVVIASAHQLPIYRQLIEELQLPPERVFPYLDSLTYHVFDLSSLEEGRARAAAVEARLVDASSRAYFASLRAFRETLDPRVLKPIHHPGPQYVHPALGTPRAHDTILDGGAFDGGTAQEFLDWTGGQATIHCVEPFQANIALLRARLEPEITAGRVHVHPFALGARAERLHVAKVAASPTASCTTATSSGGIEVEVRAADDAFPDTRFDFVKLDVEGFEEQALQGLTRIITEQRPALAISAYHRPQDAWRLPELIFELAPEYELFAAHHPAALHELELYFRPPGDRR